MNKIILKMGIKLFLISAIYRIAAFLLFSYSWQWNSLYARTCEVIVGLIYSSIWLLYGFRKNIGFSKGLLVGLIGAWDGIILMIISLVLYLNRSSYYFGPIEMVVWNIPLLGILNLVKFKTDFIVYLAPIFAILLTAAGSCIRNNKKSGQPDK